MFLFTRAPEWEIGFKRDVGGLLSKILSGILGNMTSFP